jgi:hypothetical protein
MIVGCQDDNWAKDEKKQFVQSCREEGGSKDYCECFMENVMENYPISSDADNLDFETKIELSKDCK